MAIGSGQFAARPYLSLPTSTEFNFSTGNFTFESWVYVSAYTTFGTIYSTSELFGLTDNLYISMGNNTTFNKFIVSSGGSLKLTSASTFNLNTWYHVALVKNANVLRLYVNGVLQASAANTQNFVSDTPIIGTINNTYALNGYISNLRVVKGTAVYTSGFTPPTTPLSVISGTSLLTLQESTLPITDASVNNFTITNPITSGGIVTASTFNPFSGSNFLFLF
jgi:hypothetical protein